MTKYTVTCEGWKALEKNTLKGFAVIRVSELDLLFREVAIHQKGDRTWAQLPSRPWVKDGQVVTDDSGKIQYSVLIEFTRPETRNAFSQRVIDAVLRFAPHAFGLREGAA
jgi:hypothetical protein